MAKSNKSDIFYHSYFLKKYYKDVYKMEWLNIDMMVIICIAISLILFTVSGLRKKMTLKEMFDKRLEKVLFTIMILTFISSITYFIISQVQRINK